VTFLDESTWRDAGARLASGTGARFGGSANLDAFTDTRWVTIRGEIALYSF
jgi:benzaldehyde dehydrogenase (NAD)